MFTPAGSDVTSDDKLWAALSYGLPVIIPLIVIFAMPERKARPFVKFHLAHSIALSVIYLLLSGVTLGCLSITGIVFLVFAFLAYQGNYFNFPVLTDFIKNQGWA